MGDAALRRDRFVMCSRGGFRKVPSGAAVLVETPKTCQYYFFKFIKNVWRLRWRDGPCSRCGPYTRSSVTAWLLAT